MHPYSTNSPANPKLYGYLMLLAIVVSTLVGYLLTKLHDFTGWTLGGVSAMAVFIALHFSFNHYEWRNSWLRRLLLVPDLNGEWECQGMTTSRDGQASQSAWSGSITITQSWSKMVVRLKTSQSDSQSIGASLYREVGHGFRLIYHYENRPQPGQAGLNRHSGLCDLLFADDTGLATGEYFTGEGRLTVGTMKLQRKERQHGTT